MNSCIGIIIRLRSINNVLLPINIHFLMLIAFAALNISFMYCQLKTIDVEVRKRLYLQDVLIRDYIEQLF